MREMSSAILLSSVLIHLEFIPSGELIMSEQKNRASRRPTFDFLHAPVVQLRADGLCHVEQNWIWVISSGCCRDKMERCTIVYDHGNKLKDIDRDEEPILVIFFVF